MLITVLAAAFFFRRKAGTLLLENVRLEEEIERFPLSVGDEFSISYIHSVNNSPVTNFYELRDDGIYVVKTVYFGFGAGMLTELEEGQTLSYGDDGSMIVTGFNKKIEDLIYIVGTVSDHTMTITRKPALPGIFPAKEAQVISLRDLCGRNAMVRFTWEL